VNVEPTDESKAICDLVRSLDKPSDDSLRQLFKLMITTELSVWLAVFRELSENEQDEGWAAQITEAIKLCRAEKNVIGAPSKAFIKKLRRIFS
jgi:hypothetical protein